MAQGQQLPLYYKNSKLVGPSSTKTKTKWSEYYLLVVTLFGFLMLFAGVLWFLPSVDESDGYTKAYDVFTGTESTGRSSSLAGTEPVMSPVPNQRTMNPAFHSNVSNLLTGNHSVIHDSLEGPEQQKPSSKSADSVPNNSDSGPSHDSDENTMRRNKVVQVGSWQ
jgi:hypothetical protein